MVFLPDCRQVSQALTETITTDPSIMEIWRRYFENRHEGLGTTYERFILHRYFAQLRSSYRIERVLEAPSFGMTGISGINSIWWASNGAKVTVVDHDGERIELVKKVWRELSLDAEFICCNDTYETLPFEDKSFDLAWNFAALAHITGHDALFKEVSRVTRKAVFICVPNPSQVFHLFRASPPAVTRHTIQDAMETLKWTLAGQGFMDAPPWPDIAMNKEDFFRKIGLKSLAAMLERKQVSPLCIIDYFSGRNPAMDKNILKYSFMERLPDALKQFWAHHQYFIFIPYHAVDAA